MRRWCRAAFIVDIATSGYSPIQWLPNFAQFVTKTHGSCWSSWASYIIWSSWASGRWSSRSASSGALKSFGSWQRRGCLVAGHTRRVATDQESVRQLALVSTIGHSMKRNLLFNTPASHSQVCVLNGRLCYDIKYGAKVLGQLCDSRTSYIASVTIVQRAG